MVVSAFVIQSAIFSSQLSGKVAKVLKLYRYSTYLPLCYFLLCIIREIEVEEKSTECLFKRLSKKGSVCFWPLCMYVHNFLNNY